MRILHSHQLIERVVEISFLHVISTKRVVEISFLLILAREGVA